MGVHRTLGLVEAAGVPSDFALQPPVLTSSVEGLPVLPGEACKDESSKEGEAGEGSMVGQNIESGEERVLFQDQKAAD